MTQAKYIAIDLKSFYASVECVERGLNPLDTCLVVADAERTEKTICLAVSPALKALGIPGRPRLFEVVQRVREVNRLRGHRGKSVSAKALSAAPHVAVDYIVAKPRMQLYLDYSARILGIYASHVSEDDIHVYSVDEVFIDATQYLEAMNITAHELAMRIIRDVLSKTGITATAGIGSNLYLSKIAMDIVAKKMPPDNDGVRVAELDESSYRRELWTHTPLTDFWRIGSGVASRLEAARILTMGDLARMSLTRQQWLFDEFGVNAELLIDHAWGYEPVTMKEVKDYRPDARSMSVGQVLHRPYSFAEALVVAKEMADSAALDLVDTDLVASQITLTVGYDNSNMSLPDIGERYAGGVHTDRYGRKVPDHAHGTVNLDSPTSSSTAFVGHVAELFSRIVNPRLFVRRLTLSVNNIVRESEAATGCRAVQYDLFTDYDLLERQKKAEKEQLERERRRQQAILNLRKRFGKNVVLKGLNFADGATQIDRNSQIGGHKA